VEIEPAQLAVVDEPSDVLFARVAEPRDVSGWPVEELEGAFCVERMDDGGGRDCAVHVEVEVTHAASVARPNAYFLAAIALEWEFCVLKFESVLLVAVVGYFVVFHGFFCRLIIW
jgi:hypothetical protein